MSEGQRGDSRQGPLTVARRLGLGRLARVCRQGAYVRAATFHDVPARQRAGFQAVLERLLERLTPIDPHAFVRGLGDGASPLGPQPRLLLTFDDGLHSSYEAAREILTPLGLKAAFFVPTRIFELTSLEQMARFRASYLGARRPPADVSENRMMTRADALDLTAEGHAIFPHTHSHLPLSAINDDEAITRELRAPRELVEELTGEPAGALAIPYGDEGSVGPIGYGAARNIYDACFTTVSGGNTARTPRHYLYRDGIDPQMDPANAECLLDGALDLAYALKMRRLRQAAQAPQT